MMRMRVLFLIVVPLIMTGCFGDDDGVGITMENAWPHADGSQWTYSYVTRMYDTTRVDPATELPSMEALHRDLQEPVNGTLVGDSALVYIAALDGERTTESGVTAQRMTETVEPRVPRVTKSPTTAVMPHPRRLLRLVAAARPDLREAVAARLGEDPLAKDFAPIASAPLFLGGYAFAYEDSGYFGYGDLYREHSWVYLEGTLRPGREFSLQLVRGLADDIWLHGRIWSVGNRSFNGIRYANLLECLYVVDLGEQMMTDENGDPQGTMYSYIYGTVWYAPGIGPVGCRERSRMLVRTAYNPEGSGQYVTWEKECRIEDYFLPAAEE